MSVAKAIEMVAASAQSFDDAIQEGLTDTARSLAGISGIELLKTSAGDSSGRFLRSSTGLPM
ncbi:MAG: dodecin domain-containing protein [Cyanophyceae cyanobacterium]